MADKWGGYRQPSNPAPVSGPGMLSKRTDGGAIDGVQAPATQPQRYVPGLGYGKGKEMMEQQGGAPMQGNDIPQFDVPTVPSAVPLSAPTMFPEEPITAGVDFGPGPGREALRVPNMAFAPSHTIRQIASQDPTGEMELLYRALLDRGL